MLTFLVSLAALTLVALSASSDLKSRRIPNVYTVTGVVVALVLRAALGWDPLLDGLNGAGIGFLIAFPFFALGAFGGGDTKLVVAVGAFLGVDDLFVALLATGVAGGIMALIDAGRRGVLPLVLLNTSSLLVRLFSLGRLGSRQKLEGPGAISIPYGVAIAAGTASAVLLPLKEWML